MKIKTILGLAVVGSAVYCGARLAPPYFTNYQFQDDIATIAKFASLTTRNEDDIRKEVIKKASSYELTLTSDNIDVSREDQKVIIQVHYVVPVDLLPNKTVVLKFDDSSLKGTPGTSPAS